MKIQHKIKKRIAQVLTALFVLINVVAYLHAYNFTHFSTANIPRTREGRQFSIGEKLTMLLTGVNNPRPKNISKPDRRFETITIQSDGKLEAWWLKTTAEAKGTIACFHGYGSSKSSMTRSAEIFVDMGYNVLMVDFRGCGGSEGSTCTIGVEEANDVKAAFDYLKQEKKVENIILNGSSMGSAAILRALEVHKIEPTALILQCPFGTMHEAVEGRFRTLGVPSFPMAGLLTFWGGVQHGFWAFSYNPSAYALSVHCPTLLQWGAHDDRVSSAETRAVFDNLGGKKTLKVFEKATHENYAWRFQAEWTESVQQFLNAL
jgi:uncharacterized protein